MRHAWLTRTALAALVLGADVIHPPIAFAVTAGDDGGGNPLTDLALYLGLPAGVGLAGRLLWAIFMNSDKAEKVIGWFKGKEKAKPPADVKPSRSQIATDNHGLSIQAGDNNTITISGSSAPQPDLSPKIPGGRLTNLPPDRPGFVARMAELDQLATNLTPEAAQVVIHGLPGVGKTTLARHYAHINSLVYPGGMWWLDANEGFEQIAKRTATELEVLIPGLGKVEGLDLEQRLRRCFQAWPGRDGEAVLLVVDNLPPPPEGLEMMRRLTTGLPPRFRRLLTQRPKPPTNVADLKLPVLASEDALEVFKTRSGASGRLRIEREQEEARELVEDVGRLPLALVLLGGRLDRVPSLTLGDLRKDLARSALEAKAFTKDNADCQGEEGLVATLLTSWATLGSEAMELARLLSLTLPAPIPWELIERCPPPGNEDATEGHWEDGLAELVSANLLEHLGGDRTLFELHPLVREFFSSQRKDWEQELQWRKHLVTVAHSLASEWQEKNPIFELEYWRQAHYANPTDFDAVHGLGYALVMLGVNKCRQEGMPIGRVMVENVDVLQGDGAGTIAAVKASLGIKGNAESGYSSNVQLQRDLYVMHNNTGDTRMSKGDEIGAHAAYFSGLKIAESLANCYPENTEFQLNLASSFSRLGVLGQVLPVSARREYLQHGLDILLVLNQSGRLPGNQDRTAWFEEEIQKLDDAQ